MIACLHMLGKKPVHLIMKKLILLCLVFFLHFTEITAKILIIEKVLSTENTEWFLCFVQQFIHVSTLCLTKP